MQANRVSAVRRVTMFFAAGLSIAAMAMFLAVSSAWAASGQASDIIPNHYIIALEDSVDHPGAVAEAQTESKNGDLGFVYRLGIKGYSAELSKSAVEALRENPKVKYVIPDRKGGFTSQTTPFGVSRVFAPQIPALDIDETDDVRVDADIAVLDSGIDATHPDLNVAGRTDCTVGTQESCLDGQGTDEYGHGTHTAGIAGAIDNGFGTVGIAPGARIWAVRVGQFAPSFSATLAGVQWVTAHAAQIEAVNMSLFVSGGDATLLEEAIEASIQAGVVYVVAAGNNDQAVVAAPAVFDDVITVSALSDYDGLPGGIGEEVECQGGGAHFGPDDRLASYSNWGPAVDIAAPGSCAYSTVPGGYGLKSGTSMAAPHVAGAVAILASESNPSSKADVEAIKQKLITEGSLNWVDNSHDGIHEPLLDLRPPAREAVTWAPSGLQTHSVQLNGVASPGGLASTYRFEYGASTEYGSSAPATAQSIGSGTGDIEVYQQIQVEPETTYHYRLVVTNSAGTSYGEDEELRTSFWSVQSAPSLAGTTAATEFNDVSCISKTECIGVGVSDESIFATRWNGSEWVPLSISNPAGGTEPRLETVSCFSSTSCMAIGSFKAPSRRRPFAERWNGSEWIAVSMPVPGAMIATGNLTLPGVSCTTATSCVAVGGYPLALGAVGPTEEKTLVETWNGSEWTIVPSPNPSGQAISQLAAVSCSAAGACTAVGNSRTVASSKASTALATRWNGSEWAIQSTPNPSGAKETVLKDVSCASATSCMAVGNSNHEGSSLANFPVGLTESWDGTEWKLLSSNLSGSLYGVSCASSVSCSAVGDALFGQHWNGSEWTPFNTAPPEGRPLTNLKGSYQEGGTIIRPRSVSCFSATTCTAVGTYLTEDGDFIPLVEALTPSWSTQTTPNPTPKTENSLEDVSCTSSTKCMAMGADEYAGRNVVEAWNGSEWSIVTNLTGPGTGIACPTATFCMVTAVTNKNLVNSEGATWTVNENSPGKWYVEKSAIAIPAGATGTYLRDVSCSSATSCIAVGFYRYGSEYKPLAESWNGSSWSLQSVPNPPAGDGWYAMIGVSCSLGSSTCVAVGTAEGKPLAYTWNGTSWSVGTPPSPAGSLEATLEGVSCVSSTSCKAVGSFKESGKLRKVLAESWNGTSWSILTTPNPSAEGEARLRGISCTTASGCTAVGSYVSKVGAGGTEKERKTLVERWNGGEWAIQPSTNPQLFSLLNSVSCTATNTCTVVGSARPGLGAEGRVTLGERYE